MTKVKICGLYRIEDGHYVNEAQVDYEGLIFYPKSHRFVTDAQANQLRQVIDRTIPIVGVFVNEELEHICQLYEQGTIQIIQLHGQEDECYIAQLRQRLPQAPIWQALQI